MLYLIGMNCLRYFAQPRNVRSSPPVLGRGVLLTVTSSDRGGRIPVQSMILPRNSCEGAPKMHSVKFMDSRALNSLVKTSFRVGTYSSQVVPAIRISSSQVSTPGNGGANAFSTTLVDAAGSTAVETEPCAVKLIQLASSVTECNLLPVLLFNQDLVEARGKIDLSCPSKPGVAIK